MMLGCGIPGVIMQGKEDDWKQLLLKLNKLEALLKPIEKHLDIGGWWEGCTEVCSNLVQSYQGSPDQDWWSRILTKERFVSNFLGIAYAEEDDIKSGLVAVLMKITDGA